MKKMQHFCPNWILESGGEFLVPEAPIDPYLDLSLFETCAERLAKRLLG